MNTSHVEASVGVAPPRTPLGVIRNRVFGARPSEVDPERRGFLSWESGPSVVEPVGGAFLRGYSVGLGARSMSSALDVLRHEQDAWRGFAIEGLGMAAGVRDAFRIGSPHFQAAMALAGEQHAYMLHVGLGWAWARTPQVTWPSIDCLNPLLRTLVLDGFGFHEVFFHTRETLGHRHASRFPTESWLDGPEDASHGLMQGIGRGLWFVVGGSPVEFAAVVDDFDQRYHSSLWAGGGLASTYAGGAPRGALQQMYELAGPHRRWLRQGAAFAVEARSRAGILVPHNLLAAEVYCSRSVDEVSRITWAARPAAPGAGTGSSVYASWRESIADALEAG